jgi:glycosyltransferase involved in cell wall biosynthesis
MVDNDDPALFGAAIRRVLMDESLRDQLGRQGRERVVREWTWDKAVGQLERMLNSTITAA